MLDGIGIFDRFSDKFGMSSVTLSIVRHRTLALKLLHLEDNLISTLLLMTFGTIPKPETVVVIGRGLISSVAQYSCVMKLVYESESSNTRHSCFLPLLS